MIGSGVLLLLTTLAMAAWATRLGVTRRVSDDLTPQQVVTGIGE
jgi:hypothetical protein